MTVADLPSLEFLSGITDALAAGAVDLPAFPQVVINVQQIGFVRNYAAYIPTSDAKATVSAFAFMVDMKTNAYEWFDRLTVTRSADGAWDEGPTFPGLTNAYYQVVEQTKDRVKAPFAQ